MASDTKTTSATANITWHYTQQGIALEKNEWEKLFSRLSLIMSKTLPGLLDPYQREFLLHEGREMGEKFSSYEEIEKTIEENAEAGYYNRKLAALAVEMQCSKVTPSDIHVFLEEYLEYVRILAYSHMIERQMHAVLEAKSSIGDGQPLNVDYTAKKNALGF